MTTSQSPAHDVVLIVDFGSQVTQLIARRVREAGVYSEIVPFDKSAAALERLRPRAIILSGGPASVTEAGSPRAPAALFEAGVPVLGICYGEQLMCAQLGGEVQPNRTCDREPHAPVRRCRAAVTTSLSKAAKFQHRGCYKHTRQNSISESPQR